MGAEEREPGPDLTERFGELQRSGFRYSFYRLVYMLERVYATARSMQFWSSRTFPGQV